MNMLDTINPHRTHYGRISDDQETNERKALRQFQTAYAVFRSQLQDIACLTTVMHDEVTDMLKGIEDDCPSERTWEERIEARS